MILLKNLKLTQEEIFRISKKLIPPLSSRFYKGQLLKVLIFGGEYNGAIYFAADSSCKIGADLVHVICNPEISPILKNYSPNLMVHPIIPKDTSSFSSGFSNKKDEEYEYLSNVKSLLDRVDIVSMGSGMGRTPMIQKLARLTLEEIKKRNIPVILDADALFMLSNSKDGSSAADILNGYNKVILTPNKVEFSRLYDSCFSTKEEVSEIEEVSKLSKKLGGVTIVKKGASDIICKNDDYLVCNTKGSNRRCGGQGDTLSGSIATFTAWSTKKHLWITDKYENKDLLNNENTVSLLCCYNACSVVRNAGRLSFEKCKRSMQASDLHLEISNSFEQFFPSEEYLED